MNREQWLTELAKKAEEVFKSFGKIPTYRVSCGWPCKNALGTKSRRIGECHSFKSSKDGVHEVFISPILDKPLEVAGVVCHELAHVVCGTEAGHGKGFVKVCNHVGLVKGPPTQVMPGKQLEGFLEKVVAGLGVYPHKSLEPLRVAAKKESSVTKLVCEECGCPVTISKKWLEEVGAPVCACGGGMS